MKKAQPLPQIIPTPTSPFLLLKEESLKQLTKIKTGDEIKIVYFGTPEFSAYILEKLIEFCQNPPQTLGLHPKGVGINIPTSFTIQAVVTRADQPSGRKQDIRSSPVALVAEKYGIPTLKPTKLDDDFLTHHSSLVTCDLFLVASYGKIIPQSLLDIPRLGSLNVHPSLLPKYRGPAPILTAILNGDQETGVTIMLMDAEMDHGPLLATNKVSISDQDNHQTLTTKLAQASAPLLVETLVKFVEGKVKPQKQNHHQATFTKFTKKEDSYFDINNPPNSQTLDRMIKAYYPWPTTWTKWKGKIIKFLPEGLIQMEGKKVLPLKDFLNGYPDFPLNLKK